MTHLTPDELIDAVEESLAPGRARHLRECPHCDREVTQLAAVLHQTRAVDVPEPSPLFWDQFSSNVRTAIRAEPPTSRSRDWFQLPVLAPLGALALLLFALMSAVADQGETDKPNLRAAVEIAGVDEETRLAAIEERWDVVSELLGDLDLETVQEAGIGVGPGSAEDVALQLTATEQLELVRLLRAELQRAGG